MLSESLENNCSTFGLKYEEYQERGHTLENSMIGKYKIQRRLDYGFESEVYFAIHIQTKQEVAVKLINMRAINNESNQKVKQIRLKCVQNQIQTIRSFNNPYLLQCYDLYQNQDLKLLVIEYCNGFTLQSYIQQKKKIPQKQAWQIISNILYSLMVSVFSIKILHQNHVVLRDLKADNIIRKNNAFKIANFHYAQKLPINDSKQQVRGPCMGSLKLMAPQIILRKPYGLKVDIWALGVMFFQMLYGDYPFACEIITHFYNQIVQKDYFSKQQAPQMYGYKASPLCFQFLKLALCTESQQRADASKLFQFLFRNDLLCQPEQKVEYLILQNTKPKYVVIQPDQQIVDGYPLLLQQINKQCSVIQFITSKIIEKFRQFKQEFDDNREVIQFLFLVSVRCFNTMIQIEAKLKQNVKNLKKLPQFTSTSELVDKLYTNADQYFNMYSKKLTIVEDKVTSMIYDWFSKRLNHEKFNKKQRFFIGIQKLQYSRLQQIKYTIKYFNKYVIKYLQKYNQLQQVIFDMKKYEQMNQSDWSQSQSLARKSVVYSPIEW